MKKTVQGNDTLNNNQSPPCQSWCHGLMFFIHKFLRFFLLLLLQHRGKLTITHDHLFLLLQIIHLLLFKLLHHKGELSISGDICVVFWWDRDGNSDYNFCGELIYHLFGMDLLRSIFDRQFRKVVLLMLQQCGNTLTSYMGRWCAM